MLPSLFLELKHTIAIILQTKGSPGVCVIGFNSPLYYANGDIYTKQVYDIAGLKPAKARKEIKRFGSIAEFRRNVRIFNDIVIIDNLSIFSK